MFVKFRARHTNIVPTPAYLALRFQGSATCFQLSNLAFLLPQRPGKLLLLRFGSRKFIERSTTHDHNAQSA